MKETRMVENVQDAPTRLGIELEGSRLPGFHISDVLDAIR